jgi:hypothetical protein
LQDAQSNSMQLVGLDSNIPTYRAASSFTPQATAGVTVLSIQGSATKTIRIKRILIGGSATALSATLFKLVKTSALGVGGTIVSPTVAKLDSGSAAATAVVSHYTTTLKAAGTAIDGDLSDFQLFQTTVTTPTVAFAEMQSAFPEKGAVMGQAIVLRGTAQFIEVQNANAGNLAAGSILQYVVEWTEDNS